MLSVSEPQTIVDPYAVTEIHMHRAQANLKKKSAGFKTQRNRPLRLCTLGSREP